MLILIVCNDTVKVLGTYKYFNSPGNRMVEGAGPAFERGKRFVIQIRLEAYIFISNILLPSRSSQLSEACSNENKHDIYSEKTVHRYRGRLFY